jgi:2-keto-4-pentenoate hydratase/2-oxohepta-3-ene-1,7-dioic acid hydratase in catechol pathway
MRLASFTLGHKDSYGVLTDKGIVDIGARAGNRWPTLRSALAADALMEIRSLTTKHSADHAVSDVRWLPILPDADKVMCIGRNYRDHADEVGAEVPENPRVFLKHRSAIVAHEEPIVRPTASGDFDY